MDEITKLTFKNILMQAILRQKFVIDIDHQIECLNEVAKDLKEEQDMQLEKMNLN